MKCNDCTERPRYPHWVTVQEQSGTPDAAGHVDYSLNSNWRSDGRIKARFITRGGREGRIFDQVQAEVTHIVETPSTPLTRAITSGQRLLMSGRVFNITVAYDVDENRKVVRCECIEAE